MNKKIQDLAQKQISRKDFLKIMGFGAASIFGLSTVLNLLGHGHVSQTSRQSGLRGRGFGSGPYGI